MSQRPRLPPQVEWFLSQPCTVYVAVKYDDGRTALLDVKEWAADRDIGHWVHSEIVDPRQHALRSLLRLLPDDTGGVPLRIEADR